MNKQSQWLNGVNPAELVRLNQTPEVPSEHSLIFNEEPEALLTTKTLEGPVRPPRGSASDALENEPPRLRCSLLRD